MTPTSIPYDPERRSALVDKWEERELSLEEAEELFGYLEVDLDEADSAEAERLLCQALALLRIYTSTERRPVKRRT